MAVKALTFDIIGTVFDWLDSFSTEVVPLAQEYALSIDPTTFANDALDGYSAGVKAVLDGAPWTPPDEILRDSITSLLSAAGPTPSAVEVDDFFALWRTLNPWADVPLALYALHDHFTLAILSNMSITTQSALMDHAGLPFDRTLSAETVQAYKPNPAVYQMAISSLGLLPDEIMMVAAHQYDLSAAQAQGMQTAFIARSSEPPLMLPTRRSTSTSPPTASSCTNWAPTRPRCRRTASASSLTRSGCDSFPAAGRWSTGVTSSWTSGRAGPTPTGRKTSSISTAWTASATWAARTPP
jgi:2-haloacid dehalogenase